MTIAEEIHRRGIQEVLHFTTNRGIVGILATGELLSRHRLPQEKYLEHVLHVNSATRPEATEAFDKSNNWLDFVNLSISEINRRFFEFSKNWHSEEDIWWGILSFDPVLMTHDRVVFTTTNNSYEEACHRQGGIDGLNLIFQPDIKRKTGWYARRGTRAPNLPTCEQAEVLYQEAVSTTYLRRIYVMEGDHQDQAGGWLKEFGLQQVEVVINPAKFIGCKN
jgi:ssDNA thymidine ADP-ribosyltransferase, DarT